MSIQKQIEDDFIVAYKSRDEIKISTLRMIKSALKNSSIAKKGDLSEEDILKVLYSETKKREESAIQYKKGGRDDFAIKEEREVEIISKYLPNKLSDSEIEEIVECAIKQVGAESVSDMGKVMSKVMPQLIGKADGAKVSQIVQSKLKNEEN